MKPRVRMQLTLGLFYLFLFFVFGRQEEEKNTSKYFDVTC